MKRNIRGFTLSELIVYIMIFGLFMLGVYATLEAGMKTWRIGEVKVDIYQKAQVAMSYILKDFSYSNWVSAQLDPNDPNSRYICFETPISNSTYSVSIDLNRSSPIWQGHVLYYSVPSGDQINIYRYYKERTFKSSSPSMLVPSTYVGKTSPVSSGDIIRVICQGAEDLVFKQQENKLVIFMSFKKNIRQGSNVMFNQQGTKADAGTEIFMLKASVVPKN